MEIKAFSVESKQVNAKVFRYRMIFEKDFPIYENLTVNVKGGFDLDVKHCLLHTVNRNFIEITNVHSFPYCTNYCKYSCFTPKDE